MNLQILANHMLSFGIDFEVLGQTGWANFTRSKRAGGGPTDLQIPKINLRILANYKLLFGTDFEILSRTGWVT